MVSVFDLQKLRGLLQDFYAMSHIRITVFDENMHELVSYPEAVAPYCAVIRETEEGLSACMHCDREACRKAVKLRRTYVYRCHAGLTEAVTPLYVGNLLAGYLLFGRVFSYPTQGEGYQAIIRCTRDLPIDRNQLAEAIRRAEPASEAYVSSAAHILHAVASYLILERMATLKEDLLSVQLDGYLTAHFTEKINAADVADSLGIGKTQLYELADQLYGCGIAEHIRDLRMDLARQLLAGRTELSLAEIASRCGYSDYNYFITVFTREMGISPGAWRSAQKKGVDS